MGRFLFSIVILFLLITVAIAADNKVDENLDRKQVYELERLCKQDAEEYFKLKDKSKFVQDPNDKINESVETKCNYINHYNRKMNKCYLIITTSIFYHRREDKRIDSLIYHILYDVLENNDFGYSSLYINSKAPTPQSVSDCYVADNKCKTEEEWFKLVKPYMEE